MASPSAAPVCWSSRWWQPPEFIDRVRRSNRWVSSRRLFIDPASKTRREAYAAGTFASVLTQARPCEIRLARDQFDFELRTPEGIIQPFELVEADHERRRRGDEYRRRRRPMTQFNPDLEEQIALKEITRVVAKKAAKRYRPPPHLLVYVNLLIFGHLPVSLEHLAALTRPWTDAFAEIWLLWGAHVVRTAPIPLALTGRELPID